MRRQIAVDKELETGIQSRRCVSWDSKLRSTKSKRKAESFPSAQKSVQETSFHCLPKLTSGKVTDKQPQAGSMRGASWDVLEAELDVRLDGVWNELNANLSSAWKKPEDELEKRMNGSGTHLDSPNAALWDELEAEIERRMAGLLKESTDENVTPVSAKKGEIKSSLVKAPKKKCEPPGRLHVVRQEQQTRHQKAVFNSDVKPRNSEKWPPLDKKRNKLPLVGPIWEKIFMRKLKKADSKSTLSNSSSTEIAVNTSFDSKSSSTKRVLPLRSLNLTKSASTDKKGINLPTEIGTTSGNTRKTSTKVATTHTHSHPFKEESWLQQTIEKRDKTWLERARIAMEEAKINAKIHESFDKCSKSEWAQIAMEEAKRNANPIESFDKCSKSVSSGSETSEASGTFADSESDCSATECTDRRTDTRATNYMERDVSVDSDGIDNLFSWLTCNGIMIETEPHVMRGDNPRGMVVGGKKGMCAGEFWIARTSMFQTVFHIPS
jgi:hypothetical protein